MARGDIRYFRPRRPLFLPPRRSSCRLDDELTGMLIPFGYETTQDGIRKNSRDRGSIDMPPFEGSIAIPEVADPD